MHAGHEVATAFGLPYAGAAMAAAAHQHPVLAGMSKFDDAMCQVCLTGHLILMMMVDTHD